MSFQLNRRAESILLIEILQEFRAVSKYILHERADWHLDFNPNGSGVLWCGYDEYADRETFYYAEWTDASSLWDVLSKALFDLATQHADEHLD